MRTTAAVYCLVRAPKPEEARKRYLHNMEQYELRIARSSPADHAGVRGSREADAGFGRGRVQRLAAEVDAVYHNGA